MDIFMLSFYFRDEFILVLKNFLNVNGKRIPF